MEGVVFAPATARAVLLATGGRRSTISSSSAVLMLVWLIDNFRDGSWLRWFK